jgi:hypothetical protein
MTTHGARGISLIEVTIVAALAMLVILGMIGFYVSSQATWMMGSTQALIQQDASLLLSTMSGEVRQAARAMVMDHPDASHQALFLYPDRHTPTPYRCFYWRDSCVYSGTDQPRNDDPLAVTSKVSRLQFSVVDTSLVRFDLIELPITKDEPVRLCSAAALYNR